MSIRAALRRTGARLLQAALGLAAGAAVSEVAFCVRDHGAFPHLNVYVPDARLGVRLRPGAEERVAFNGNPLTHVRIDRDGFRGPDLPPPSPGEVLVVGDSQVFGLGVEEDETFAAELARRLPGRPVLNLGVPTYGPLEFDILIEEVLAKRFPGGPTGAGGPTVVYTVNFANDLFEADRPNAQRHAVWDGWAVRSETAPEATAWFPGRELIFRESHAVFALRSLAHLAGDDLADQSLPSEGTWKDLLGAAASRRTAAPPVPDEDLAALIKREVEVQLDLEARAQKAYPDVLDTPEGREYRRTHGNPQDIVVPRRTTTGAEGERPTDRTVGQLVQGAKIRREIERSIQKRAAAEIKKHRAKALLATLREREEIQKKIDELTAAPARAAEALSPLRGPLARAKATCDARGARLVVLALPLDVQVSPAEWVKYGAEAQDMSDVKLLVDDLMTTAAALKLDALDVTPALAAAEPGAFLDGDIHMTPKGHRAVAAALAGVVGAAAREAPATPGPQANRKRRDGE